LAGFIRSETRLVAKTFTGFIQDNIPYFLLGSAARGEVPGLLGLGIRG
jgi:hypothetical protein